MCRYGAPGGARSVTFGTRVRYAAVERGSAETGSCGENAEARVDAEHVITYLKPGFAEDVIVAPAEAMEAALGAAAKQAASTQLPFRRMPTPKPDPRRHTL